MSSPPWPFKKNIFLIYNNVASTQGADELEVATSMNGSLADVETYLTVTKILEE